MAIRIYLSMFNGIVVAIPFPFQLLGLVLLSNRGIGVIGLTVAAFHVRLEINYPDTSKTPTDPKCSESYFKRHKFIPNTHKCDFPVLMGYIS